MATKSNADFQSMLNEYLPNEMFYEEVIKRDWLLTNVERDDSWKGSRIPVPFMGAKASTVEFGQLAGAGDISQSKPVRGVIEGYKEVWGSLIFNHKDLLDHDGKVKEASFLQLLPDELEQFQTTMKEKVSQQLLNGKWFDEVSVGGTAGGILTVKHPERYDIGQKVVLQDDGTLTTVTAYVAAIDVNTNEVTFAVSRAEGAALSDLTAITAGGKCYHPGVLEHGSFVSLREAILSAANGGSTHIHGQLKTKYPALQAVQLSGLGLGVSATNILEKLFTGYNIVRQKAKGNASKVVMSYKHLGNCMAAVEKSKGAFSVTKQPAASIYGWTEISITSVKGELTLVGVQEMEDDVIFFLDMKAMKFRTRGGFKKRTSPEGKEYFEVRASDGYQYIIDSCLFGEMEYRGIGQCAVMYGINYV